MIFRLLSCLIAYGLLSRTAEASNSYVITIPNQIRPGVPLGMTVNILKASGDVHISSKLKNTAGTVFSNVTKIFSPGDSGSLILPSEQDTRVANLADSSVRGKSDKRRELSEVIFHIPTQGLTSGDNIVEMTGSGGLVFHEQSQVRFNSNGAFALIQTDRVYFTLGEIVKLRVVTLHPNLLPYDGSFDVRVRDSSNTNVFQWLGVSADLGVWEREIHIDSSMKRGKWNIEANVKGQTANHQIIVRQIVIPKFNVTIDTPISFTDGEVNHPIKVYARYSFAKPVYGTMRLQVLSSSDLQILVNITTNMNGTYTYVLQNPPPKDLIVVAQVGDSNAGTIVTSSLKIVYVPITFGKIEPKFTFKPERKTFRPGLPFVTYVHLPDSVTGHLHAEYTITTFEEKTCTLANPHYQYKIVKTLTKNLTSLAVLQNQYVKLQIQMPEHSESMYLTLYEDSIYQTSESFDGEHSPTNTYLNVQPETPELQVGSNLSFQVSASVPLAGNLIVQIVARGIQIYSKQFSASVKKISVPVSGSFYPKASVLVYNVLPTGEIISDEFHIDVAGSPTENQLSLRCTNCTSSQVPGSDVNLNIKTAPNSKVFLLGIDDTINFVQTGYDISLTDIVRNVNLYSAVLSGDTYGNWYKKRSKLRSRRFGVSEEDTNDGFVEAGMNLLTDAKVYDYDRANKTRIMALPQTCTVNHDIFPTPSPGLTYSPYISYPIYYSDLEFGFARKNFPKTWIWESVDVGNSGETDVVKSLPDSITTWTLTGFAVGRGNGFAITESPIKIKSLLEAFIDVQIPSFVVANNSIVVRIVIYNYKSTAEKISVEIERDDDANYWETEVRQIPPNQNEAVFFPMSFRKLLQSTITVSAYFYRRHSGVLFDRVRKILDVKAPGVEKEYNIPTLIGMTRTNNNFVKNIDLPEDPNIVPGSKRIFATVTGDILSPSINGLEKLIRMPTGCGEQTMLSLAPDVFILKYLNSINRLEQNVKNKAISYMMTGRNRELSYQREDGSFSAWGNSDSSGSTWLTAFVLLSFHEAQEFIGIDDHVLEKAVNWLLTHQNSDGSFSEIGRIIHYQMQGGSKANKVTMTSFVLMSLLESENLATHQQKIRNAIQKARSYIEQHVSSITDVYTLAVSGYALKRARSAHAKQAYDALRRHAVIKDGSMYWQETRRTRAANIDWLPPNPRARPIEIEITAYALLYSVLSHDFDDAMSIVRWLTSQRNPDGGMTSTQDTVVSLRALSEYSTLMSRNQTSLGSHMHVSFNYDGYTSNAYVTDTNKHLLQTVQVQGNPKKVEIVANGEALAIIDVVVKYNVKAKMNKPVFEVIANVTSESFDAITVTLCVRRLNHDNNGMVIAEVGLPCGFNLNSIGHALYLKHTESDIDKVYLYFDQMTTSNVCFNVQADRIDRATQSQSIPVFVYDYYEPENQGMGNYTSGILKNMKLCDLCKECRICHDVAVG